MELHAEELWKIAWKALNHGACSLSPAEQASHKLYKPESHSAMQLMDPVFCLVLTLAILLQFFLEAQETFDIAEVLQISLLPL